MYMIIDDFGTVARSEQPKELLKQWVIKEIESIMNTYERFNGNIYVVSI